MVVSACQNKTTKSKRGLQRNKLSLWWLSHLSIASYKVLRFKKLESNANYLKTHLPHGIKVNDAVRRPRPQNAIVANAIHPAGRTVNGRRNHQYTDSTSGWVELGSTVTTGIEGCTFPENLIAR